MGVSPAREGPAVPRNHRLERRRGPVPVPPVSGPKPSVDPPVEALYGSCFDKLARYAVSITRDRDAAHDLVQETFLRFIEAHRAGADIPNPEAWMYSVVRNLALDRLRQARETRVPAQPKTPVSHATDALDWCWRELEATLAVLLTARELECVRLRRHGLTHAEVARQLGVRAGTVSSLLSRASAKARDAHLLPANG
jgi:RNA polymerase sigma-70 factor, ECF subfamily